MKNLPRPAIWKWRTEIFLVRSVLAFARVTVDWEASSEVNQFFVDRYLRLAEFHRRKGAMVRARRLYALAAMHWHFQDPEQPPPAIADVMPVPLPPLLTWAVSPGTIQKPGFRKAA